MQRGAKSWLFAPLLSTLAFGSAGASARAAISDEPAVEVMQPSSERLDSSSAAATSAVTFPSFDINARRALRGTIMVCRQHCAPIMTIAGGTTRGISRPHPVSWNAAPASPAGARILWRRYPLHRSHQREGLPAGLRRLSKVPSALCGVCMTRPQTKRWAAGVEARRPCTTAWCDQISTPAENQLRFLFVTHLCP
jgi:hypothetical protein